MIGDSVTIGIVNYNGIDCLPETLDSIFRLRDPAAEVILVDNHSTDGSREWVQSSCPQVRCICLDRNVGLPEARNVILAEAETDYVFIMDNDICVEPDMLRHLVEAMRSVPQAAACHPDIHDPGDPLVYHYNGGWIHYLCAFVSRPKPGEIHTRPKHEIYDVVSGGALMIDRRAAEQIGGFDADYFFNWEDGDFTSRMTLSGYRCVNVPAAVVHHRGKPRGTSKVFYQTRNRWFYILKLYSWRTLLLSAPMFLLFELAQALFLTMKGAAKDYWKGNLAVIQWLPVILRKRRAFQRMKVVRDRDWLKSGDLYVPGGLVKNPVLTSVMKLFSSFSTLYWKVVRPLC